MSRSSTPDLKSHNVGGFAFVFVVVNLHVLRNLALAPYLAVYAATVVWLLHQCLRRQLSARLPNATIPVAWLLLALAGGLVTAAISGPMVAAYGLTRFLFAFPVFLALAAFTDSIDDLRRHIRTMVLFFAVGSLSVPIQYMTGPISIFAADAERAGLERYASIFGSLTSLGVAAGAYIVLAHLLPSRTRIAALTMMAVGGVASLSKAALANIGLGLILALVASGRKFGRSAIALCILVLIAGGIISQSPQLSESLAGIGTSFGIDSGIATNDRTVGNSAMDRLTELPKKNMASLANLDSPLVYLAGGGFGMASTALVPKNASLAPMAHNQFAEFVSVFGVIGGVCLSLATVAIAIRLRRLHREGHPLVGMVFWAFILWMVNAVFANGAAYQPITASVLFLGMFLATQDSPKVDPSLPRRSALTPKGEPST